MQPGVINGGRNVIGICKILFDLCFYYTLSGFFLYLITVNYPSIWGLPLLMLSAFGYIVLKGRKYDVRSQGDVKKLDPVTVICCALPALLPAFNPSLWQIFQYLPAWAFLCFTLWNGLIYTNRRMFEDHFTFTGRLFFLVLFGVYAINTNRIGSAVTGAVPYLILYLLTGVCLMRILREEGKLTKSRNIAVMLVLLLGSTVLAGLQMPQLILSAAGFLYRNVISWVFFGLFVALGTIIYGIITFIARAFAFLKTDQFEASNESAWSAQEIFGEESEFLTQSYAAWLEVALAVLLTLAVLYVIFIIFRKLLGKKTEDRKREFYKEEHESLKMRNRSIKRGIIRPKDPRQAVRWYYRKYLKAGSSRGGEKPDISDTSLKIWRKFSPFFPVCEAGKLRDQYIAARYRYSKVIGKSEADMTAELWSKLKQG